MDGKRKFRRCSLHYHDDFKVMMKNMPHEIQMNLIHIVSFLPGFCNENHYRFPGQTVPVCCKRAPLKTCIFPQFSSIFLSSLFIFSVLEGSANHIDPILKTKSEKIWKNKQNFQIVQ